MALVDPASLPNVLDAAAVSALGDRLVEVGNAVTGAVSRMQERWGDLSGVFQVTGAEGVPFMIDRPAADAADFAAALSAARAVMWDAASLTLPALKERREELAARITTVNADYDAAATRWQTADAEYWTQHRADAESDGTTAARRERTAARAALTDAEGAGDALRDDIARFRRDVENAEDLIASQLRNVTGGTDVHGPAGEPVRVSQTFWGFVDAPYPGAPTAAATAMGLSDRLSTSLSGAVAARIGWLGEADPDDVTAWMAAHPDFASAVGFVDPPRAARLWNDLAADSVPVGADGTPTDWIAGPLAQLLALAPLAIGNLNGAPATQRDLFSRAGLEQILAGDQLDGHTRDKLETLASSLARDPELNLLSVFLDTDGTPRATLAWGDVDTADQVTTVSHGIDTDLGSLSPWSRSAQDLRESLDEQLRLNGTDASTAVVLFMEWDSGDMFTVQGIDRPDAGAARLEQLLGGFAHTNPAAQRHLVLHSLGTTMGAQAVAENPGLVDGVWMFGSAGLTQEAAESLATQIDSETLTVRATHSSKDWVAPLGRTETFSEHPVDPRTVSGVTEFGSDGGFVADYAPDGARGEPTEGHNAQESEEMLYWGIDEWVVAPDGTPVPLFDTVSTGYLDKRAESFLRLVSGLAKDAEMVEAR